MAEATVDVYDTLEALTSAAAGVYAKMDADHLRYVHAKVAAFIGARIALRQDGGTLTAFAGADQAKSHVYLPPSPAQSAFD